MFEQAVNAEQKESEYHVASFVAHAIPAKLEDVQQAISLVPGAEIHATSEIGKIVFTVEAASQKTIGRLIDEIRHHAGLLNLAPVYHQFLNEESNQ